MGFRPVLFFCLFLLITIAAFPSEADRSKRDVAEDVKNASNDMGKTIGNLKDSVIHVFEPTEKSPIDKMEDSLKSIGK
ncbi:unnamed protein product, partial [Iphiclides podalirius]